MSIFNLSQCYLLEWSRADALDFPNMVKIPTIEDKSSFFHALFQAHHKVYINEEIDGKTVNRVDFIHKIRIALAEGLRKKYGLVQENFLVPLLKRDGMTIDKIADAIEDPDVEYDIGWTGYICATLNIDIYILEESTWSVYLYTEEEETCFLRPGHRDVVVLLKSFRGYSTIGLIIDEEGSIATFFGPKNRFIRAIRTVLHHKREVRKRYHLRKPTVPLTDPNIDDFDRVIESVND